LIGHLLHLKAMGFPNPFGLSIRTIPQGRDYVWLVTGGEAHVGAVAVAYWQEDGGEGKVQSHVLTIPLHKEGELARELAELACRHLKTTVTVAAGIHIDQATSEEIGRILEEVRRLAGEELDFISTRRFS
jgi:gallate decarboxylase subunit D